MQSDKQSNRASAGSSVGEKQGEPKQAVSLSALIAASDPELAKRIPSWVDNERDMKLALWFALKDMELEAMKDREQANEYCGDDEQ